MERVQVAEREYPSDTGLLRLSRLFHPAAHSPALSLDSFEIEQSILIERSYCLSLTPRAKIRPCRSSVRWKPFPPTSDTGRS